MKYIIRNLGALLVVALLAMAFVLPTACNKSKDSVAVITVVDSLSFPISGALVKLNNYAKKGNYSNLTYLPSSQTTGADGKAYFHFPLEAVLTAEVSKGYLKVIDIVRLKKDDTVNQTIILK
jgi:hypothetical protein